MQNKIDTLQVKISEARSFLTRESREAIDSVSWKLIISGMGNKYNQEQLENLEIETELLLCGILSPKEYQEEIMKRMMISEIETNRLLGEMDRLIFKKIQEKLISLLSSSKENKPNQNDIKKVDKQFSSLPVNLQEAIGKSNYQIKIYEIGQKYKLPIDQMGVLEEIIKKAILGDIIIDKLEFELKSKIKIPEDKMSELIGDINNEIFKDIRSSLKSQWEKNKDKKNNKEEIPLPPYDKTTEDKEGKIVVPNDEVKISSEKKEEVPIPNYNETITKKEEKEIYAEHGIEMVEEPEIDIVGEKMIKPTASTFSVSDYSLPKVNSQKESQKTDLYREEI